MLDFALMHDATNWDETTDRHLRRGLSIAAWRAIFFKVLIFPEAEYCDEAANKLIYLEPHRRRFHRTMLNLGYPMLARMTNYFDDAWYAPAEVGQLRDECLNLAISTDDKDALEGLEALVRACHEARKSRLGLFLAAD